MDPSTKDEITNLTKSILATFTTQYTKHYTLGLVKKTEEEAGEKPEKWKLMERGESTDDLKSGYLTKEGGIRKSWKKRWFIVRADYSVDYYTDEATANKPKAKPKGTMSLAGYWVVENVNEGLLKDVEDLAKKMSMNVSDLPKPKQYTDLTIEIKHYRRRTWYIQCETPEQKSEWVEMFRTCCRRAWGLKNKEEVHENAFHSAVRETRWSLGRWGWWTYGGSEEQILSDLISDEIDYQTMYKVYSKLSGPWMVRNKLRNTCLKMIDTIVSSAVKPAWAAMAKAVEEVKPKVLPVIKELVDPLGKAKSEILGKIKDAVLGTVNPVIEEKAKPHFQKIVDIITSPVRSAFSKSITLFEEQIQDFATNTTDLKAPDSGFRKLNYYGRSWWSQRPALSELDIMYEPLWLLREIFTDIYPWRLIWDLQDKIMKFSDNAVFTFQEKLKVLVEKDAATAFETAKAKTMKKFNKDIVRATANFFVDLVKQIVMPPLNSVIQPLVKPLIEPIQSAIPDAMKTFIDLQEMFDKLIDDIFTGLIKPLFTGSS